MKIAITGANGFIGTNLITHLSARGHEVTALLRSTSSLNSLPRHTSILRVDYSDVSELQKALCGTELLIHNAGKTKALSHQEMLKANLGTTETLIQAINALPHPIQLIYISSQAASRPSYNNIPINEAEPSAPLTSYGKSKLAAEKAIRDKCQKTWTIVRPCSVYGCGDKDFLFLFKLTKLGFNFRIGHKDRLLNMLHVSQLASFIELCSINSQAHNQVFYATDGSIYRQSDIFEAMALGLNKHPLTITIPEFIARLAFIMGDVYGRLLMREVVVNRDKMKEIMADSWLADPNKAINLLGWKPQGSLKEHMRETAVCYRKLGWL